MKISSTGFVILFLFMVACNQANTNTEEAGSCYYIDAENGRDSNTGLSEKQAFATLEKANSLKLKAGDQVLFKSGTNYYGQLKPQGGGSPKHPVIIGKFGGDTKPAIHGEGKHLASVHIYNMSYVELHGLEITNTGEERENGRRGVIVEAENFGVASHIILDDLHIHDVNGSLVKSKGGGSAILWKNHGAQLKTKFDSLIIQYCHLENCARNGINSRGYTRRDQWHPSTNVIVRHNLLEGIPGDGIVPIGTDGAVIEYNVMRDCPDILSHKEAAAGIWPWSADNTIIQFNEVSGHKAKWDGQGFDSDWNCLNTIIQYNYSHDNYGGFLLVCNNGANYDTPANIGTFNTIIRYNISVNDGIRPYETERRGPFSPLMHISGPVENTLIYKNIFLLPASSVPDIDKTFIQMDNWGGPWPMKTLVSNNIIDLPGRMKMDYGKSEQTVAVMNDFDQSKLGLIQQEDFPEWAVDYEKGFDIDYLKTLTEAFFEDNEEMKRKLEKLVN
jgi:hypothetical protein